MKLLQDEKGYRYSLDPFLLAHFVELKGGGRLVDLGTGSGVIAILLADKYEGVQVTGVELQEHLVEKAAENIRGNGLDDRVDVIQGDIRQVRSFLPAQSFETAVGNPPYRKKQTGRISPHQEKAIARHEVMLSLEDFVSACSYLLVNRGRLNIIYHPGRLAELFAIFHEFKIAPRRLRPVYSSMGSEAVMVLVEGVKNGKNPLTIEKPLIIYKDGKEYTDEVKSSYPD